MQYTVTTEEKGLRATNAVKEIQRLAEQGAFDGKQFPLNAVHAGVKCRVEVTDDIQAEDEVIDGDQSTTD